MKAAAIVVAVLALAGLAGCDLAGTQAVVFGSLVVPWSFIVPAGTPYHVILYAAGTAVDLGTSFDTAARAVEVDGQFPSPEGGGLFDTVNYQAAGVQPGAYSVFAWVDVNDDGVLDPWVDLFGWHGPTGGSPDVQPAANVVVAKAGLVDVDIRLDTFQNQNL